MCGSCKTFLLTGSTALKSDFNPELVLQLLIYSNIEPSLTMTDPISFREFQCFKLVTMYSKQNLHLTVAVYNYG